MALSPMPVFFAWLEENIDAALALDMPALQHIIARSCAIKAEVVGEDEHESDAIGRRAILNYGHTVGHAIEATTAYGEYLHGEAIAIGMTVAARLARNLGVIDAAQGDELLERQTRLFQRVGLPTDVPQQVEFERLWAAMTLDKKSRGDKVNFVLPTRLGEVRRVEDVSPEDVRAALTSKQ
jgi:3-dehydroquinate synthase